MKLFSKDASPRDMACISLTSISHLPRRCCETSLPSPISGQPIREPLSAKDRARRAFHRALRTLEHDHAIALAPRLGDPGRHGNEKHLADRRGVLVLLSAEICFEPSLEAPPAIPIERVEKILNGVKPAFDGAQIDGLMCAILAQAAEPGV